MPRDRFRLLILLAFAAISLWYLALPEGPGPRSALGPRAPGPSGGNEEHPGLRAQGVSRSEAPQPQESKSCQVEVRRLSGDVPIEGATVTQLDAHGKPTEATDRTDAEGRVTLKLHGDEAIHVRVTAENFVPALRSIGPSETPDRRVVVHLEDAYAILGRVVDEEGAPVANAMVQIVGGRGGFPLAKTDEMGSFRLAPVASGELVVAARHRNGPPGRGKRVRVPLRDQLVLVLPGAGTIAGTIVDASTGAPLEGALVVVTDFGHRARALAKSDAEGAYAVGPLDPRRPPAYVSVSCPGYRPADQDDIEDPDLVAPHPSMAERAVLDLGLAAGDRVRLDFALTRGAVITGTVSCNGAPVGGAQVQVFPPDGSARTRTDAQGRYRIEGVGSAPVVVRAHVPGLLQRGVAPRLPRQDVRSSKAFRMAGVEPQGPSEHVVDIELYEGGHLEVAVIQVDGTALVGGRLRIASIDGRSRPSVELGAEAGHFNVGGLTEGDLLRVGCIVDGYEQVDPMTVRVGDVSRVQVLMRKRAVLTVRGTVRSEGPDDLENAFVQVAWVDRSGFALDPMGRWKLWASAPRHPVGRDGSFEVTLVGAPGRFALRASALHHTPTCSADLRAEDGERVPAVDLVLGRGTRLEGVVLDTASGDPIAGAAVTLTSTAEGPAPTTTSWHSIQGVSDARGAFAIDEVPAGRQLVVLSARGYAPRPTLVELPSSRSVTIRLDPLDGFIAGLVESETGAQLQAARVTAAARGATPSRVRCRPDGTFHIAHLPRAPATVSARATGHAPATEAGVRSGTEDLRLLLRIGATAAGRLVDARGHPLARAWIRLVPSTTPGGAVWLRTDDAGRFRRDDVPAGRAGVFLHEEGRNLPLGEVVLPDAMIRLER